MTELQYSYDELALNLLGQAPEVQNKEKVNT